MPSCLVPWARLGPLRPWLPRNSSYRAARLGIRRYAHAGTKTQELHAHAYSGPDHDARDEASAQRQEYLRPVQQPQSNNWKKRRYSSPGDALTDALAFVGATHNLPNPNFKGKLDASYFDWTSAQPWRLEDEHWRAEHNYGRRSNGPRPSLQTVLASYLRRKHRDVQLADQFPDDDIGILHRSGYEPMHVQEWADVLTSKSASWAAQVILSRYITAVQFRAQISPLPWFIPLYLLRRVQQLPPDAIHDLLTFAWATVEQAAVQRETGHTNKRTYINESTFFIMIVRLVRHCQLGLPEGIVSLARLFNAHGSLYPIVTEEQTRRRTYQYNKLLVLLARPTAQSPFSYALLGQRAQFDCIQAMAEQRPPLMLNREGFRSIAATQLMSKKTSQERDWAELKAKSWPPWKEDKTGLDADKGKEYGTSKALSAIERAREAGYGSREWENVVKILSGWDLDQTPTIQQRAINLHRSVAGSHTYSIQKKSTLIWAARVKATRTVQEAWAAFLSWKEQSGNDSRRAADEVYFAMFERLVGETHREKRATQTRLMTPLQDRHRQPVLPGDSRETTASSESPKERVYLREPLPSPDELARDMRQQSIWPSTRTICFLVRNTRSLTCGVEYIEWAAAANHKVLALLEEEPCAAALQQVEPKFIHAFLSLLCNQAVEHGLGEEQDNKLDSRRHHISNDPILFAWWLLLQLHPNHPPAWHVLLDVFNVDRHFTHAQLRKIRSGSLRFRPWNLIRATIGKMKEGGVGVDAMAFQKVCVGLERAVCRARVLLAQMPEASSPARDAKGAAQDRAPHASTVDEAKEILENGAAFIKSLFGQVFAEADARLIAASLPTISKRTRILADASTEPLVPAALRIPTPYTIHAYIRVLGSLEAWPGILYLLGWLITHQKRIYEMAVEQSNGRVMLRRCLIALRVYMEDTWAIEGITRNNLFVVSGAPKQPTDSEGEVDDQIGQWLFEDAVPASNAVTTCGADPVAQKQAKQLVDCLEGWGGWPSREECVEYCTSPPADTSKLDNAD